MTPLGSRTKNTNFIGVSILRENGLKVMIRKKFISLVKTLGLNVLLIDKNCGNFDNYLKFPLKMNKSKFWVKISINYFI